MHSLTRRPSVGGRTSLPPLGRDESRNSPDAPEIPSRNVAVKQADPTSAPIGYTQEVYAPAVHSRIPVHRSRATSASRLRPISRELPPMAHDRTRAPKAADNPKEKVANLTDGSDDLLAFMEKLKSESAPAPADDARRSGRRSTGYTSPPAIGPTGDNRIFSGEIATVSAFERPANNIGNETSEPRGRDIPSPAGILRAVMPVAAATSPFSQSPFSQLDAGDGIPSRPPTRMTYLSETLAGSHVGVSPFPLLTMTHALSTPRSSPSPQPAHSADLTPAQQANSSTLEGPGRQLNLDAALRASHFNISAGANSHQPTPTQAPRVWAVSSPAAAAESPARIQHVLSPPRSPMMSPARSLSALQSPAEDGHAPALDILAASFTDMELDLIKRILQDKYGLAWSPNMLQDLLNPDYQDEEDVSGSFFRLNEVEQDQLYDDIETGVLRQGSWKQARDWLRRSIRASTVLQPHMADSLEDSIAAPRPSLRLSQDLAMIHPERARTMLNKSAAQSELTPMKRPITPQSSLLSGDDMRSSGAPALQLHDEPGSAVLREHKSPATSTQQPSIVLDAVVNIPVLPCGRTMKIHVTDTWGDARYVGLTGIEIFSKQGKLVRSTDIQSLFADPEGVCVLPGHETDPRTIDKLFDGMNLTKDDTHMWLAPWDPSRGATISFSFTERVSVALLRIYNYNKDRIHSYRGARNVVIYLDNQIIYNGELQRAPGSLPDEMRVSMIASPQMLQDKAAANDFAENILFTTDPQIINLIAENDPLQATLGQLRMEDYIESAAVQTASELHSHVRPVTAEALVKVISNRRLSFSEVDEVNSLGETRVFAADTVNRTVDTAGRSSHDDLDALLQDLELEGGSVPTMPAETSKPASGVAVTGISLSRVPYGRTIQLDLLSNHGDADYIGLTGIEVFVLKPNSSTSGTVLKAPLSQRNVFAQPKDINVNGHSGDPRTLDKVVDGINITNDDSHMWLIPYDSTPDLLVAASGYERAKHLLVIDLGVEQHIFAIKVYNYNQSPEAAARGARHVSLTIDGCPIINQQVHNLLGVDYDILQIQRAPGSAWYDFGQLIRLEAISRADRISYFAACDNQVALEAPDAPAIRGLSVMQDYDGPTLPAGQVIKFIFSNSCGDPFFIGLDALALYDAAGIRIPVIPNCVRAMPESVNDVDHDHADCRRPANLAFDPATMDYSKCSVECRARRDDPRLYQPGNIDPHSSWLAPVLCGDGHALRPPNLLALVFDHPVTLSFIRIVNYGKTPSRGVGAVDIFLDDYHIFSSELQPNLVDGRLTPAQQATAIIFRKDKDFVDQVVATSKVSFCGRHEQDILCYNDGHLVPAASSKRAIERAALAAKMYGPVASTGKTLVRPKTAVVADESGIAKLRMGHRAGHV